MCWSPARSSAQTGTDGLRVGVSRSPAEPGRHRAAGARVRGGEGRGRTASARDGLGLRRRAARGSRRPGHRRDRRAAGAERRDPREALRPDGRPGARRLGPARRAAADRRDQSARRVALLLRGTKRGAAARCRWSARRLFAGEKVSVEGVYVPFFRRGRFDRLDEPTSPFNLQPLFVPNRAGEDVCQCAGRHARERDVRPR